MSEILVVGDCHIEAKENVERFKWLGNLIARRQPDRIVTIGDFLTLDCLSSWNENKRLTMEGQRYQLEIQTGKQALDYMFAGVPEVNKVRKRRKKGPYEPRFHFIYGNHEYRLDRYIEQHPELQGAMDIERDLDLKSYGAEVTKYHEYALHNNIMFQHIPFAKNGRPISGMNIARKALMLTNHSIVFGHTHCLNVESMHRTGSMHLQQALNCGCFFEHQPDYVAGAPTDYWRGVCILHNYSPMRFDLETISLRRLQTEYTKL